MRRSERGGASLSVEVLMWAPIALVIIGFVVGIGRMSMAQDAVSGAAGAAARAAS
ncbi:ATP/GTP-binding protein, partial [Xanthomonas citri pv. citri]|nr:ATP/GTP-binding protein [Xanthomonas citri pv. citri]